MKVAIISDLHREVCDWDFTPDPDLFYIIAGDIDTDRDRRREFLSKFNRVFHVLGNHDYWGTLFPLEWDDVFTQYYNKESETTKVVGATLWTDLSNWNDWIAFTENMADYDRISHIGYDNYNNTHAIHRDFLLDSGADIIVTHHCPSYQSLDKRFVGVDYNASFCSNLDERILAMSKPPKLWVHGHTHTEHDYMIGETRVICHPRGYPHEHNFLGYKPKVIEI